MTNKRINEILKSKKIEEIYYNNEPIWIQKIKNNTATIGFLNSNLTKDIYIYMIYMRKIYTIKMRENLFSL